MPVNGDPKDEQKEADQGSPNRGGRTGEQGNQVVHINEKAMPDENQTVNKTR